MSPRTRDALARDGYDVVWTGDWPSDPGDGVIMQTALNERRILVTLDKDFGALAVALGRPHCGIVRLVDLLPSTQAASCRSVLDRYGTLLAGGAIATVTRDRIRIRPAAADGEAEPPAAET